MTFLKTRVHTCLTELLHGTSAYYRNYCASLANFTYITPKKLLSLFMTK